jgi:hypothetical protein
LRQSLLILHPVRKIYSCSGAHFPSSPRAASYRQAKWSLSLLSSGTRLHTTSPSAAEAGSRSWRRQRRTQQFLGLRNRSCSVSAGMSQSDHEAAMMMTMAAAELEHRVELLNKCGRVTQSWQCSEARCACMMLCQAWGAQVRGPVKLPGAWASAFEDTACNLTVGCAIMSMSCSRHGAPTRNGQMQDGRELPQGLRRQAVSWQPKQGGLARHAASAGARPAAQPPCALPRLPALRLTHAAPSDTLARDQPDRRPRAPTATRRERSAWARAVAWTAARRSTGRCAEPTRPRDICGMPRSKSKASERAWLCLMHFPLHRG